MQYICITFITKAKGSNSSPRNFGCGFGKGVLGMICPVCGGAELIADVRDVNFAYKGHRTVIPNVMGDYCPACKEIILNMDECGRTMDLKAVFIRKVDALQA